MQAWQVQSRVPEVTSSLPGHMFDGMSKHYQRFHGLAPAPFAAVTFPDSCNCCSCTCRRSWLYASKYISLRRLEAVALKAAGPWDARRGRSGAEEGQEGVGNVHMQRKCTQQSSIPGGKQKAGGRWNALEQSAGLSLLFQPQRAC